MSTNVTKICYRMHVPDLDGTTRTEVLDYFRPLCGEPEYLDLGDDGTVEHFSYTSLVYVQEKITDPRKFLLPIEDWKNKRWGLEFILGTYNHDRCVYQGFNTGCLNGHAMITDGMNSALLELGLSQEIIDHGKLYAYTWYNGGDEPVHFD